MSRTYLLQYWHDRDGLRWWRLVAPNGRVLATSPAGGDRAGRASVAAAFRRLLRPGLKLEIQRYDPTQEPE